jgi:hypothetical protein
MTAFDLANRRLRNQRLVGPPLNSPDSVVGWLGAVQAQDYPGPKWAVAQRTAGATGEVAHLLPNYGEHLVAYKDHAPSFAPAVFRTPSREKPALTAHIVTIDGLVVGGWRGTVERPSGHGHDRSPGSPRLRLSRERAA